MNRISRLIAVALLMAGNSAPVFACGPAPAEHYAKTEKRVRERFDSVDSIVLLTLLDVRRVSKIDMGVELQGEKSIFRIDRVFKGAGRPGDKLTLTTYSTCANYVVGWAERADHFVTAVVDLPRPLTDTNAGSRYGTTYRIRGS